MAQELLANAIKQDKDNKECKFFLKFFYIYMQLYK